MKRYLILSIVLFSLLISAKAQNKLKTAVDTTNTVKEVSLFLPTKGDFTIAIQLGKGNFYNGGLTVPNSPGSNYWVVPGNAPYANVINENYNSLVNMVGVESRYFFNETWAIKISGGAIIRDTPARDNIPGYIDPELDNVTWIPDYNAVIMDNELKANVVIGGEYHFKTKFDRVSPYLGVSAPFYYSRHSQYNPTVISHDSGDVTITDISVRHVELMAFGGQLVGGVDFYLAKGFYTGFEIKPASYLYSVSAKYPVSGVEPLKADNHTYSFFTQPYFKLGFMF